MLVTKFSGAQVNEMPQMDSLAAVLREWMEQSSGVTGPNGADKFAQAAGAKSVSTVHDANSWMFGSSDD